jgi:intein-encoded DNA endonuclease-like protein
MYVMVKTLEIVRLYTEGNSAPEVADKLNISIDLVYSKLKKNNIKRRSHKEAANLALSKNRIKIYSHNIPESSKTLTKEKAYVIGVMCGDGYLHKTKNSSYQVAMQAIDKEFVEEFARCLEKIYKIKPTISFIKVKTRNWNNKYQARTCRKLIYNNLLQYSPSFKTKEWIIPNEIKNSNLKIQSAFLKGFFDSEGCIEYKSRRISGTSTNLNGLKEIQKLLHNFNIRTKIQLKNPKGNRSKVGSIRIQDRRSIETYAQHIGLTINRKKIVLEKALTEYKLYVTPHKESKKLVPKIIELRKKGLPYNRIAKEVNLSIGTVWRLNQIYGDNLSGSRGNSTTSRILSIPSM